MNRRNRRRGSVDGPSADWPLRTDTKVRGGLRRLERLTLGSERPVTTVVGTPRLNPLYHTGTISVFLFGVVFLTGVYLMFFFQYGFDASYDAVSRLEGNAAGRLMRAVHRYASIALVVTSLLHGWRTLVQDRFRGARWVAWVSGVWMMVVLWVVGVTGYWLIWDERAGALTDAFVRTVAGTKSGLDFAIDNLLTPAADTGWPFILLLFLVHVGLSIAIGVLLWYHLRRLSRAKVLPPRFWMIIVGGAITVVSVAWPLGMLPAADPNATTGAFPLDPFYLFLLPAWLESSPAAVWGGFLLIAGIATALPWLLRRPNLDPIVIDNDLCTGCTLCVADCPYDALVMVPRDDDSKHRQLAVVDEKLCVACGVCIGSCPVEAMTLGQQSAAELWDETKRLAAVGDEPLLVFTCERHALHGAAGMLGEHGATEAVGVPAHVIAMPCIGMAHPNLVAVALEHGAGGVQFVGCPPADCANREGNQWMQERLNRDRLPRLKRALLDAPVTSDWVAPDLFGAAVTAPGSQPVADPEDRPPTSLAVRSGLLVALVTILSIVATTFTFTPGSADDAVLAIALEHAGGAALAGVPSDPDAEVVGGESRLVVEVDGAVVFDEVFEPVAADGREVALAYESIELTPGQRDVVVRVIDDASPAAGTVVFDDTIGLVEGDQFNLALTDVRAVAVADAGRSLYFETTLGTNAGCRVCHSLDADRVIVGPSFDGVATRAASRVPGLSAEEYLRQSIIEPNAYVVDGFPEGQMLQNYEQLLTAEDIDNLVAFLLTLE